MSLRAILEKLGVLKCPSLETCVRKVRYRTQQTAEKTCELMATRKKNPVPGLTAYPCPHCRGWHIGHKAAMSITVEKRG